MIPWILVGYALGSVPFAFILARRAGIDVRVAGSGNVGAANVLRTSGTPLGASAMPVPAATGPALDAKAIEQALGRSGRDVGGGVFQVTVPRAEKITGMGHPLLPAMGVTTVMNFQPTANGKAAITGDFVLLDKEVNAVARTLRQHGIDVTALHNHGLMDTPRLFYMHFWATDDAVKLAQGLKAALEQTNSQK